MVEEGTSPPCRVAAEVLLREEQPLAGQFKRRVTVGGAVKRGEGAAAEVDTGGAVQAGGAVGGSVFIL